MRKKESSNVPDVNRDEWNVKELSEQSTNEMADETLRRTLRGDAEKGNPNDRDIVGAVNSNETQQGREEAKNDTRSKANRNG